MVRPLFEPLELSLLLLLFSFSSSILTLVSPLSLSFSLISCPSKFRLFSFCVSFSLCLCLKLTFYLYAQVGKILVNSVLTVDFYESKFDNFEFEGGLLHAHSNQMYCFINELGKYT